MKIRLLPYFSILMLLTSFAPDSFRNEQLKYPHVKEAYKDKWEIVKQKLNKAGVDTTGFNVFIRVFKQESKLEVWAKTRTELVSVSRNISQYKLVETYPICKSSGELGPKRKQGDGQVPEGFYHVSSFTAMSEFYLALGVSYPNKSDLIKGDKTGPGGDIMIHGNCVTIGCMPLTDDKIKEVYILAVEARNSGQQTIPIHIFPTKLDADGLEHLKRSTTDTTNIRFWANLQAGYAYFESKRIVPEISIDKKGDYKVE